MHYQGAARASYNEARMTPLTLPTQTARQTRASVGNGTPVWAYHDYWGTVVSSFDIHAPTRASGRPWPGRATRGSSTGPVTGWRRTRRTRPRSARVTWSWPGAGTTPTCRR